MSVKKDSDKDTPESDEEKGENLEKIGMTGGTPSLDEMPEEDAHQTRPT